MTKGLSLALLLCVIVSSAGAVCMSPQPRLVCAEYFKEQAVVIARLVRTRYVDPKNDVDYRLYTMKTERVLHGQIDGNFRIYEENSSGRAGFEWKEGETYLLFLSYIKRDKGWELDGCGNSGPLRKSAKALKEIDKINAAGNGDGGIIAGVVWFDPGITVIARGAAGIFRAKSNQEGRFSIHVPPGIYSVRALEPKARFVADDFSYELPRRVRIVDGSCAQVCFNRVDPDEPKHPSERLPGR
jgi:hypothetical protein